MAHAAPHLYGSLTEWWFRKARWLKRKGSPTSNEVLHRLESLRFPTNAAEAVLWCRDAAGVLPAATGDEAKWLTELREKLGRWREHFELALRKGRTVKADLDWTFDRLLSGRVTLDEAVLLTAR